MSQSTNINKSYAIAREKLIAAILMQITTKKAKNGPFSLKKIGLKTTFVIFWHVQKDGLTSKSRIKIVVNGQIT